MWITALKGYRVFLRDRRLYENQTDDISRISCVLTKSALCEFTVDLKITSLGITRESLKTIVKVLSVNMASMQIKKARHKRQPVKAAESFLFSDIQLSLIAPKKRCLAMNKNNTLNKRRAKYKSK